jgi:two-component system alkaline phosphatase synthesis response regulator PhoP
MAGRVLFVGKIDVRLRQVWSRLQSDGFDVAVARSRKPSLHTFEAQVPQVVVVDMTVPRTGAEKLCQVLRKEYPSIPVVLLIDADQPPPRFPHDKTLSRAASVKRICSTLFTIMMEEDDKALVVGSLRLDPVTGEVTSRKGPAHLCPKEAQLLAVFMENPGQVLRHRFLMKTVWDTDFVDDLGTLWTHMSALRRKIEPFAGRRVYLHTVRGIGYRLDVWPPPTGTLF